VPFLRDQQNERCRRYRTSPCLASWRCLRHRMPRSPQTPHFAEDVSVSMEAVSQCSRRDSSGTDLPSSLNDDRRDIGLSQCKQRPNSSWPQMRSKTSRRTWSCSASQCDWFFETDLPYVGDDHLASVHGSGVEDFAMWISDIGDSLVIARSSQPPRFVPRRASSMKKFEIPESGRHPRSAVMRLEVEAFAKDVSSRH